MHNGIYQIGFWYYLAGGFLEESWNIKIGIKLCQ